MSLVSFVVHRLEGVELGVDPEEGVAHGEIDGDAFGVADVSSDDCFSFCSVHPSGFNLGFVSGICPEHEAMLGVQGNGGWIVQLAYGV